MMHVTYSTTIPPGISEWHPWSRSICLGLQRVNTIAQSAMKLFLKYSNLQDHDTSTSQMNRLSIAILCSMWHCVVKTTTEGQMKHQLMT